MNILELDSYNLADAVKFNEKLNPRIWQGDKMKPQVRAKLLQIAEDFKQSLGLSDLEVKDITVSGSNAGYTYTPNSDIDLHLVVDLPQADSSEVYRELFDAKKFQYNETHNITIGGYDVELYVENANEPPVSQGMYSVVKDDWINIPLKKRSTVNDNAVKSKYDVMKHRIESAIASKNFKRLTNTAAKIKKMRQAGLDKHGELGPENLAYKMLRTQGTIKALYDARTAAQDKQLSLKEQPKPEYKKVYYGFTEDVGITPDGVSPETKMFLSETDDEQTVADFIKSTAEFLGIENLPKINLHSDPDWGEQNHSFGRYDPDTHELHVNLANRHIMDVLRTTAHELAHCRQHEIKELPLEAGETGSPWENEAHAVAGIVMRNYADQHPEMFQGVDLNENASGYIPKNKKEAKDPRYSMALTVDIKPGQVGKEANKLALQTDKQGKPALLMKTANTLAESLSQELALFEQDLFEVKMTSKNLAKLAKDIKGVKVGLEFEMIVPDARVEDDGDMEPDYEQDERVRDIDDAVNFFDDGDYNSRNELRRLREAMQDSYWEWKTEKIDELWHGNQGWEFFTNYLDREDPFDPSDYEDRAEDEVKAENPELDPESDEFEELKSEKLREYEANYYQEQWDDQGYNYDNAREEFEEEQSDDLSEEEWLSDQSIRYASDVESNYGYVTWPYYTSSSGDEETDIERIALDFMNGIGADTVAYSSSYHGSYKKWTGNGWVLVGSEKPDDCFSIEPDGSLDGNSSDDVGLEFVSPPTPLEQVPDLMKRVQSWAADNGVYTGKANKTSIHTNISVPGYDLDKLDYLKAALLLGDEYVLREFDRIGNTYAAPAIEKVKQLVQQKPEKAQELLDKMKSQLNAEASKLIHSGVTNKFTSINTKDNRVEFRSPGGDYLSIIADNPQKMIDTINRMVVTLDAAMDPNKYKEEYQKKLYKVLTGQGGGREAKSGLKKEMKASDKDLINIFSRYAAGELPRAALKSFVRQAQLERQGKKAEADLAKHNWAIRRRDSGDIVRTFQADDYTQAFDVLQQYKQKHNITDNSLTYGPYNAGEEKSAQQPSTQFGAARGAPNYAVVRTTDGTVVYRFHAADRSEALGLKHDFVQMQGWDQSDYSLRDESESTPIPGSTLDLQRQRAAAAQQQQGNWGIWIDGASRFANRPGEYPRGAEVPLYRFPSREAAEQWIEQQRAERPRMRTDIEVREIEPREPLPDIFPELPGTPAAQQGNAATYEIYNRNSGAVIDTFTASNDQEALQKLADYRNSGRHSFTPAQAQASFGVRRGPGVDNTAQPSSERSSYELYRISDGRTVTAPAGNPIVFLATDPADAESKIERYVSDFGLGSVSSYAVRSVLNVPAQSSGEFRSTENVPREGQPRNLVPTGPGPWEIYRISNGESVRRLEHTNRAAAEEEARSALGLRGEAPELYGVRTQQSTLAATGSDAAQGGLVDLAGEQPATSGSFTGEWKIVDPNGNEIYRFSGVGNAQSDANRVAMQWLQRNPRQMQAGVEVLPVMG